jgi:hypothetical protein
MITDITGEPLWLSGRVMRKLIESQKIPTLLNPSHLSSIIIAQKQNNFNLLDIVDSTYYVPSVLLQNTQISRI